MSLRDSVFYVERQVEDSMVEVAIQYNDTFVETVKPFANNVLPLMVVRTWLDFVRQ